MGNELAVIPGGVMQPYDGGRLPAVKQLGEMLAKSGFFSDAREAAQAAVKVMAGEELGLAPVASMMGINIVKGKVALSANLMAAQVRRHGYNYHVVSMDVKGCVIDFIGKDGKSVMGQSSFNEDDAKAAGVWGSDSTSMYKKYPRNMYFSRAMSNGVKWFCPEVTSGLPVYTPEELGARVDGEGEMLHEQVVAENIDTGGHPIGTQAAANHVAERKVSEMKSQAKSTDFQMLESFGKMKKAIGEKSYYIILGNHTYEHANEITDKNKAKIVYMEMEAFRRSTEKRTAEPVQEPQPAAEQVAAEAEDVWPEGRE